MKILIAFMIGSGLGLFIVTRDWFFNLLEKIYNKINKDK